MRSDPIRVGTLSALGAIAFAVAGCGGEQPASAPRSSRPSPSRGS